MKKNIFKSLLILGAILTIGSFLMSCGGNDADNEEEVDKSNVNISNIKKLKGTSWNLTKKIKTEEGESEEQGRYTKNAILTFSDEPYNGTAVLSEDIAPYAFNLYASFEFTETGTIYPNEWCGYWSCYGNDLFLFMYDSEHYMSFGNLGCSGYNQIIDLSTSAMHFQRSFENYFYDYYYSKTSYALNGSSSGDNGDSGYEKPDVGFYDYTATKTSLKIQYKIYNKDEAKVSSAKIYYGTSSASTSKTATVSGVMITANISGLKAGTTYYVKCVATGKGGTTTTETTKVMTNY